MIVVDTTVLVYAVGTEHPLRESCRRLLSAIASREIEATTTVEVIQEFAHVRARRRGRADASTVATAYVDLFQPLAEVAADVLRGGLGIFADTEAVGAFDAVLAAIAQSTPAVDALVSADRGFAEVPGLRHVFPDEAGVASLLA